MEDYEDLQKFYNYIKSQTDRISELNISSEKKAELYLEVRETIERYERNRRNFTKMDKSVQKIVIGGRNLDEGFEKIIFELTEIKNSLDSMLLTIKPTESTTSN